MRYKPEELARLHAELLDILAEIVRVCTLCDIPYFIQGGSAIGALYNRGIVPWDDDIDIGMTRENYERFLREAPQHLRPQYFLEWFGTEPNTPFYFAKVKRNGTLFVEQMFREMDIHHGIFVDIFPYDRIPDAPVAEWWHRQWSRFWINCFIGKAFWPWRWCGRCEVEQPLPKSFAACLAIRAICTLLSRERIYDKMCHVLGAYNHRDCRRVNIVRMPKDQIPRADVENTVPMSFGGLTVAAPRNIEAYLRHHYPNLRPVLPEEEQINHAPYKLSFGEEPTQNL